VPERLKAQLPRGLTDAEREAVVEATALAGGD
jgi:hypothetical protein